MTSLEQAFVWSALIAATFRAATPLTFAALGGIFSERSGVVNIGLEGMLLIGAFFGFLGADKLGDWWWGILAGVVAGAVLALVHAFISIHLRADQIVSGYGRQLPRARHHGLLLHRGLHRPGHAGRHLDDPSVSFAWLGIPDGSFVDKAFGDWHLLIWVALAFVVISHFALFRTPVGLRLRSVGEHPKAADTVGISVYGVRYAAVISPARSPAWAASTSRTASRTVLREHDAGRGFIALAAVIFGRWRPFGAFAACLLFGFTEALALRLPAPTARTRPGRRSSAASRTS